jgi:hypothetical protein
MHLSRRKPGRGPATEENDRSLRRSRRQIDETASISGVQSDAKRQEG